MRLSLVPKTDEFYDLFIRAGENAVEAARLVEQRFREFPDTEVAHARVKEQETNGDHLTRDIINLLNTQYVTPFDREDIYSLARRIDDVVDHIEHASELLDLYKVEGSMEQAIQQCRVLVGAAEHLAGALGELRGLRYADRHLVEMKNLEDEADRIVRDAIAALFESEDVSPRLIIAWKDIFEALEAAVDACENAGHVIGNVVVKNA